MTMKVIIKMKILSNTEHGWYYDRDSLIMPVILRWR